MSRSATINPKTMSFFQEALGSAHLPVDVAEFNGTAVAHRPKRKRPLNRSHSARRNASFPISASNTYVAEVAAVQGVLIKLGFLAATSGSASNVDGKLGPTTQSAIQAFQRANSINPTNNLDQTTYNKILAAGSDPEEGGAEETDDQGNKITKDDIMEGFEIGQGILGLFGVGKASAAEASTGGTTTSTSTSSGGMSTTTILLIGGAVLLIGGGGLIYALTRK